MISYEGPLNKFRDIIREAGDDDFSFEIDGDLFHVSMTYGETDLIPCPKNCKLNSGFYTVIDPDNEFKDFIQIMYQCSYCDNVIIKNYNEETLKLWSKSESVFITSLIKYVLTKQSLDVVNYGKRQKIDIFNDKLDDLMKECKEFLKKIK